MASPNTAALFSAPKVPLWTPLPTPPLASFYCFLPIEPAPSAIRRGDADFPRLLRAQGRKIVHFDLGACFAVTQLQAL